MEAAVQRNELAWRFQCTSIVVKYAYPRRAGQPRKDGEPDRVAVAGAGPMTLEMAEKLCAELTALDDYRVKWLREHTDPRTGVTEQYDAEFKHFIPQMCYAYEVLQLVPADIIQQLG